ncbi:MAG: transporter substrate-binding domain-containing protein [bacterium]|nr:transporter substrate-binding domain-containing protein [bacterium]
MGAIFLFVGTVLSSNIKSHAQENSIVPFHPEIQSIIDRGELVVAIVNRQAPPFFFKEKSGELVGFDIQFAKDIAQDLGVTLKINQEAPTYNDVIDLLALGKADIGISNISLTLGRAKKVLYSNPYAFLKQGVILNRLSYEGLRVEGKEDPSLIEKLNQPAAIIGVIPGSSFETWAKDLFSKATFVETKVWDAEFVRKLNSGEIMAAFRSDLAFRRLIASNPELKPFVQPILLKGRLDTIHIVVPSGYSNLLQWINSYIFKKRIHVTVDDLFKQYPELLTAQ